MGGSARPCARHGAGAVPHSTAAAASPAAAMVRKSRRMAQSRMPAAPHPWRDHQPTIDDRRAKAPRRCASERQGPVHSVAWRRASMGLSRVEVASLCRMCRCVRLVRSPRRKTQGAPRVAWRRDSLGWAPLKPRRSAERAGACASVLHLQFGVRRGSAPDGSAYTSNRRAALRDRMKSGGAVVKRRFGSAGHASARIRNESV